MASMSMSKYFETIGRNALPHPQGRLSSVHVLSEETIQSANDCIRQHTCTGKPSEKKRGLYQIFLEEKKAEVGRYTAENGVAAADQHFAKELPKSLNESKVQAMKRSYLEELSRKRKAGENPTVNVYSSKNMDASFCLEIHSTRRSKHICELSVKTEVLLGQPSLLQPLGGL